MVDLLTRLGFQSVRRSGKELFYRSPLRDSDTTPSFFVNDQMDVWYDQGIGKGGNIIDFGLAFWPTLEFKDVLIKIQEICQAKLIIKPERPVKGRIHALKVPHYNIEEVKELGSNPAITAYLQQRGIWAAAQDTVKEVYYFVEDEKKLKKHFFAAGWKNELGGWEVRNKYFKGCLGHKAVTNIPGSATALAMFEGYINYLSWRNENPAAADTVMVLNSISLLDAAILRAKKFEQVNIFFDRDKGGHDASITVKNAIPHAVDQSAVYDSHNDYNDMLLAKLKSRQAPEIDLFKNAFVR